MKIISNILTEIEGIQIYYIVGLLIFVTLFIVLTIRTMRRSNKEMDEIKNSILIDEEGEELQTLKS